MTNTEFRGQIRNGALLGDISLLRLLLVDEMHFVLRIKTELQGLLLGAVSSSHANLGNYLHYKDHFE